MFHKKPIRIFFLILAFFLTYKTYAFFSKEENPIDFENSQKTITLNDNGLNFKVETSANSTDELLEENNIQLGPHDEIMSTASQKIYPGANIEIKRAIKLKIEADGKKIEGYALSKTVREALKENGVEMGRLDKSVPEPNSLPENGATIVVTRINVEEIDVQAPIDFKITVKKDPKMGWRDKKIETPGEKGIREMKYKVTYRNGKEISRVLLSKNITQEPVTQVETQGTLVKVGKSHKGQGTWYAFKGGLFAASPWLPMGSYAKVTNTANGKSVIVQINDRGPFGPGRIIDLDKVAWQKVAPLGAGVIGVKVEEVLN